MSTKKYVFHYFEPTSAEDDTLIAIRSRSSSSSVEAENLEEAIEKISAFLAEGAIVFNGKFKQRVFYKDLLGETLPDGKTHWYPGITIQPKKIPSAA